MNPDYWGDATPPPPPPGRSVRGQGIGVGIAVFIGMMTLSGMLAGVVPWIGAVLPVGTLIAAFVLVANRDAYKRGIGVGLLISFGCVLLLVGACFAVLAGSGI